MISDRIPATWDMALRWNKYRQKWIEHVYDYMLKRYNNNCMKTRKENEDEKRKTVERICSGKFNFAATINTDRLFQEDTDNYYNWMSIIDWVKWFSQKMPYIKSSAKICYDVEGLRGNAIAESICKTHGINMDLSVFILKHLGYEFD